MLQLFWRAARRHQLRQVLSLFIQLFVLVPQLLDLGVQFIDPLQTLAQQEFEAADSALPVFQLAAQSNDLGAQSVILVFEQLEFGAGRLAVARVHGAKERVHGAKD